MPRFIFRRRENGKQIFKQYDTDKSLFICHTPDGDLYKKKVRLEYFIYNSSGKTLDEKIKRDILWKDAEKLCRQYGTKETYDQLFTIRKKSTNAHTGPHSTINLDDRTRIMAHRAACNLGMNLTEFVRFLIQKWDDYH